MSITVATCLSSCHPLLRTTGAQSATETNHTKESGLFSTGKKAHEAADDDVSIVDTDLH